MVVWKVDKTSHTIDLYPKVIFYLPANFFLRRAIYFVLSCLEAVCLGFSETAPNKLDTCSLYKDEI